MIFQQGIEFDYICLLLSERKQKAGWSYEGPLDETLLPHGKGKLFFKGRLTYRGEFMNGRVVLSDLVRRVKDDKKVIEFCRRLGTCSFRENRIDAVCQRGWVPVHPA